MESEDGSLEEGEIVDYTPLQRPEITFQNNCVSNGRVAALSSDEDSPPSSDSDIDSDNETKFRSKKQKLTRLSSEFSRNKNMNKYNVWSVGLQEDSLTENLVKCGVEKIDRSRDVESYDYLLKYRLNDGLNHEKPHEDDDDDNVEKRGKRSSRYESSGSNKRRHWECGNAKQRVRRQSSSEDKGLKDRGSGRTILDLTVTDSDSPEHVAKEISTKLLETKEDLILRVVNVLGIEKAISLYNETKRIEEDGGMMVMNGSRRRTPGGVYLCLVKHDDNIPREKIKEIFVDDRAMTQQFRRRASALKRNKKTDEIKKSLIEDGLLLPNLLTRTELELRNRTPEVPEGERPVTNPPPSPATDCDNTDSVHVNANIISYNDDFLELNADDDMEVF